MCSFASRLLRTHRNASRWWVRTGSGPCPDSPHESVRAYRRMLISSRDLGALGDSHAAVVERLGDPDRLRRRGSAVLADGRRRHRVVHVVGAGAASRSRPSPVAPRGVPSSDIHNLPSCHRGPSRCTRRQRVCAWGRSRLRFPSPGLNEYRVWWAVTVGTVRLRNILLTFRPVSCFRTVVDTGLSLDRGS